MWFFIYNMFSWEFENNFVSIVIGFFSFSVQVNHFTEFSGELSLIINVINLSRSKFIIFEFNVIEWFLSLMIFKGNRWLISSGFTEINPIILGSPWELWGGSSQFSGIGNENWFNSSIINRVFWNNNFFDWVSKKSNGVSFSITESPNFISVIDLETVNS